MPNQNKDSKKPSWMKNPFHGKQKKADSSDGRSPTQSARASPTLPGHSKAPPAAVEPPNDTGSVQLPKNVKPEVSTVPTDLPVLADSALGEPAQTTSKPEDDYSTYKLLLWDEAYEALKTDDETKTLMATYEEFLADPKEGLVEDASLLDGKSGQEKMNMLLQWSLEKTAKLDKVEARIAPAIDIVLSVKTSIGAALSSIPIAAAVWAPICIILQVSPRTNIWRPRLADRPRALFQVVHRGTGEFEWNRRDRQEDEVVLQLILITSRRHLQGRCTLQKLTNTIGQRNP